MFASNIVRELALSAKRYFLGVLGWLVIAPIGLLVPKQRHCVAVLGRESGKFVDNTKYFFLQARQQNPDIQFVFITELESVAETLRAAGLPVKVFPRFSTLWFLLRCRVVVVDSIEWSGKFRRFLLMGARTVQLWHGVGFKRIELDKWSREARSRSWMSSSIVSFLRMLQKTISGRWLTYDALCTTSVFYRDEVFAQAFKSRNFIVSGYARNTFGSVAGALIPSVLLGQELPTYSRVLEWKSSGRRVVLVAPTFRDTRGSSLGLTPDTVGRLDEFCAANAIELVFKFHPLERGAYLVSGKHLHCFASDIDIYPFFALFDALITDYSSIYMDYLLLDRPVLFFVPDLEEYIRVDRQIQFDYHEMTPGPKLETWPELMNSLVSELQVDSFSERRQQLKQLAFDGINQETSVPTIVNFIRQHGWLG